MNTNTTDSIEKYSPFRSRLLGRALVGLLVASLGVGTALSVSAEPPADGEDAAQEAPTKAHKRHKRHRDGKRWQNLTPEQRAEKVDKMVTKRVAKMTKKLDLTEEQAKEIEGILRASAAERSELFTGEKSEEKREKMHELRQRTRKEIAGVLTDEQREKAKEMRKRHRKGKKGKRGKHGKKGGAEAPAE